MKIEIISVNALGEGAEMLIGVAITGDSGMSEKRKFLLFTEQYLELGLCRGAVIDADTFDRLEEMSKRCVAMRKGSDLLAYSSSSRVRLAQRLRQKGIDRESAEDGLIDEEADVESLVRSCLKKLWGKKRIYRELCAKGYDRDVISRELEGVDEETIVNNCVALFRKKHKIFPSDPETQKKIIASLVRYGYSFGEIKRALQIIEK